MFAKLLLTSLFLVSNCVFAVPLEHAGLHRRRSSSTSCLEVSDAGKKQELSEWSLGVLVDESTGKEISNPHEMYVHLRAEIIRLCKMQREEARYIQDLKEEIAGFASPIMRMLNWYASGVELEVMLKAFEENQDEIKRQLHFLMEAFKRVRSSLLMRKIK